ncbi:hypothetical protein BLA18109_05155 [Burkholderia lata]|uniref:Uncharacterized protein n=2 Tax=Burkholderia lata (strain ATCC 17760 / DSM 23089 / LMG 22485 / NCIMB 9086 / R18194 / 383) TaxID=482957 RepID=A0A6P2XMW5_BURL3|nr:hypothetical protein BLA18109_05155 [Burkholderia lata]
MHSGILAIVLSHAPGHLHDRRTFAKAPWQPVEAKFRTKISPDAASRYAKIEPSTLFNRPNGVRMTTHITIEFTEHAAEAIGEQTSTSFSYDQGAHVPQPGDFVELENSRQTFFVIGRVFSLKANYCAVKLVLDLPPPDGEQDFDQTH